MANAIDERGFFWWLGQPDGQTNSIERSIPGSLKVSEEGHIKLDLDGALWDEQPSEPVPWGEPRHLPAGKRITGRLGSYGGHVLLERIERTDFSIPDTTPSPQSYEAEICVTKNSPFNESFNLATFRQLRVELAGLEEWLNLDSIHVESDYGDEGAVGASVRYTDHKFPYDLGDGSISIESFTTGDHLLGFFRNTPKREATFEQTNSLVYTPNAESSLDTFKYVLTRIEELLALFLGSYFRLGWPTLIQQESEDEYESWYQVYSSRGSVPEFKPNRYFWWVGFSQLRESFGRLLSAWKAQSEDYGAGYYLYLAELRNPLPYSEHRFVNLIWALESLHKKQNAATSNTPSAIERKARIQSILNKLARPEDARDREWFEERTANYQRDLTLSDRIFDCLIKLPIALGKLCTSSASAGCLINLIA